MNPLFNIHERDREHKEISKKVLHKKKLLQVLFFQFQFSRNFLCVKLIPSAPFYDQGINFVGGFYFTSTQKIKAVKHSKEEK